MLHYFWPIILVIGANSMYNICAKSTPENVNSFATLCITYLVAAVASAGMFFLTAPDKHLLHEFSQANWTAIVLGLAVIGLEFGYINIYRVGWKINTASLVANIGLACILLLVGYFMYKETISLRQLSGILVCGLGLFLLCK